MLTVILNVTSGTTDIEKYAGFLKDGDTLHTVLDSENIIEKYNEIVDGADKSSDILLLSERIDLHGNIFDEMRSCLYAGEKHAIVYGQEIENKESLIKAARKYLPKYTLTILPDTGCALIKRSVITTLGFFDPSYKSLRYALMDYYYKLNTFGFSSIISHHSLYSLNSRQLPPECETDRELFTSKYPYWEVREDRHALYGINPCARFLNVIDTEYYPRKKILFNCAIMPPQHCGTSEYQISAYEAFCRLYGDEYDIFMYTNHEADEYHKLSLRFNNILYPDTISGVFHLGYTPNQLMHYDTQLILNEHCLKSVQTMFDIMTVRIDEHFSTDVNTDVELGVRFSDGIVFISDYTKNDFLSCFAAKSSIKNKLMKVIYPATGINSKTESHYELPFEKYFLIIGNTFKHKAVKETIEVISSTNHNYIVVGAEDDSPISPNIHGYKSGYLSDDFLGYLYANCTAVIFPSLYEGFGFPVVMSLKNNKRVIVNSNALNDELINHFARFEEYFLLFENFAQIANIVNDIDFTIKLPHIEYSDTWDRVAGELKSFFDDILETEVDADKLSERWFLYKLIESSMINAESRTVNSLKRENVKLQLHLQEQLGEFRFLMPIVRFKKGIRGKFPKLFKLLKGVFVRS